MAEAAVTLVERGRLDQNCKTFTFHLTSQDYNFLFALKYIMSFHLQIELLFRANLTFLPSIPKHPVIFYFRCHLAQTSS
jgi:hypothetical protein